MCIIESKYFIKSGNASFDCKAVTTDKIEAENIVTIQAAEVGIWCYVRFTVMNPDGSNTAYNSLQQTATLGTMTFTSSTIPLVQGTYTLISAGLFEYVNGIWVLGCESDVNTGTICNTLNVTAPCTPPSCSFNIP